MRIFKKILAFLLANILAVSLLQLIFVPPSKLKVRMAELERDDYDTVVLGHSLGRAAMDPKGLEVGNSEKVFNLCVPGGCFFNTYYILKHADRNLPLKKVYLDLDASFWNKNMYESAGRHNKLQASELFPSLDGWVKLEYFKDRYLNDQFGDFLFPYLFDPYYLQNPGTIVKNIKIRLTPEYLLRRPEAIDQISVANGGTGTYAGAGYEAGIAMESPDKNLVDPYRFSREDISESAVDTFGKIVRYCKEYDIELITFTCALPPEILIDGDNGEIHNFYAELTEAYQVPYYDMNYLKFDLLPRDLSDYSDLNGHMAGELAYRHSVLLNEIANSDHPEEYFEVDFDAVLAEIEKHQQNP